MPRQRTRPQSLPLQDSDAQMTSARHTVATADPLPAFPSPDDRAQVQVISGAHLQTFPLAGLTIGHARTLLEQVMTLHPEAPMLVNGNQVAAEYVLRTGDTVEFVHHAGEKGMA